MAILTSGGDAPGMNAAVRAAVGIGVGMGWRVMGVEHGYRGLVAGDLRPLGTGDVDGWARYGGSVLGTSRCPEFARPEVRAGAIEKLVDEGVNALLVIGGNGSLTGAHKIAEEARGRIAVIGIPASIDNDLACTSLSIGVDTALNTIVEACDRILDTASSHDRTFIVEVMGRDCGYLAMTAAVAVGADGALFPEAKLDDTQLVERVVQIVQRAYDPSVARNRVLIVVAEGVGLPSAKLKERVDIELAGRGLPVETRITVLGHVVRGGSPSALDRLMAARLAHGAVQGIVRGMTDVMVGWHTMRWPGLRPSGELDIDPYITFWPLAQVLHESAAMASGESDVVKWRARLLSETAPYMSF